ncbi:MAG: Uma2 family endonuclease [Cyanobacteria bacterium J06588_4]
MTAVVLNLEQVNLTDEQFYHLCHANQNWNLERTARGDLVIMPRRAKWLRSSSPTTGDAIASRSGESGQREADLITDLNLWNRQAKLGVVFSSSTIFSLPNGGDRYPDAAWIKSDRWNALTDKQQKGFPPLCPDFVIELRSQSDALKPLQEKMQEYLDSGLQLGWLIDPQNNRAEIYHPQQDVQVVELPTQLSGKDVLPGFSLKLAKF